MNKRQRKKFKKRQNKIIDEAIYVVHHMIGYLDKKTDVDVDSLMFQLATTTESSKVISKKIAIDVPPNYIKAAKIIAQNGEFCGDKRLPKINPRTKFLRPSTGEVIEKWNKPHTGYAWYSEKLFCKIIKLETVEDYERYVGKKFVEQF